MSDCYREAWDYLQHDEAEKLAAKKLSRCKRYFLKDGAVYAFRLWWEECKFCFSHNEDPETEFEKPYSQGYWDKRLDWARGDGCKMCFGTGLRFGKYEEDVNYELSIPEDAPF